MNIDSASATITLTIETFNDISTGNLCTLSGVQVTSPFLPPGVIVAANPLPPYTVRVADPQSYQPFDTEPPVPISLTFSVVGPPPPNGQGSVVYNVEGIYFNGSGQGSVFTNQQIASPPGPGGTTVTVTDGPTLSRPTGRWTFVLIVQRVVTSGGIVWKSIGIIDPPIDNEPC